MSSSPAGGQPEKRSSRPGCLGPILLALGLVAGALALRHKPEEGTGIPPNPASLEQGHEVQDMEPRQAILALGLLVAAVAVLFLVVTGFQTLMTGRLGNFQAPAGAVAVTPNAPPPPAPRLETANGQVLEQVHAQEDALLHDYAWIDQKSGVVRIPIDRAIDITAQRGLPVRSESGSNRSGELTRPSAASSGRTPEKVVP